MCGMSESLRNFAQRVKVAREVRGLSQGELGAAIGSDQRVISVIESGRRDVKLTTLKKLAVALRVSVEWLLKDEPVTRALFAVNESKSTYETGGPETSPKVKSKRDAKKEPARG